MVVDWKDPADPQRLRELIDRESNAKQRDRYRVVLIAGEGLGDKPELYRDEIAAAVHRARQFVDKWVGRYRDGGIGALVPRRQPGAIPKLTIQQQKEVCEMLDAGPSPQEALAAYNGPILREKIEQRFGKVYSLAGVYKLLHRLGFNDLMPRPTHPDTDPAKLEAFKKRVSRDIGSDQSSPLRIAGFDLLPGRSPLRPAWNDHPDLGTGWHQAPRDPSDPIRLSPCLHRRLPPDGRRPWPGQPAHEHPGDECVPSAILRDTASRCACGDGAGSCRLARGGSIKGSRQRDAGAFAPQVSGVESDGEPVALSSEPLLGKSVIRNVGGPQSRRR